ncbi:MAG TPA: hypothetical protein VND45_10030 [Thermoanaerobaculia bacterium]|nr:hypothetical protein [Thermoanaerobaculia bacterium]
MSRIALILLLAFLGCSERVAEERAKTPAPPPRAPVRQPPAPVRTDRSAYVLAHGPDGLQATIVTTLRAPAGHAVYILNCNGASGVTLQRKTGDAWVYSWVVGMSACMSPPIVVPPGGEHTARLSLHDRAGAVPGGGKLESGTYRVVWSGVLASFDASVRGLGPELPLEQRVSAPIIIEVPQRR